jgi:hypothetical protein
VGDFVQLLAQRGIEPRMSMAVNVAPQTADAVQIFTAVDVNQRTADGTFNQ